MPIAVRATKGAWYRDWRLVSLDGSTLDVADEQANEVAFGRPGSSRGGSAYPQIRFVALVENGTHVLFASRMAGYGTGEITLAKRCSATCARACCAWPTGSSSASRCGSRRSPPAPIWFGGSREHAPARDDRRWPDGSYLSRIYPSERDRRHKTNGASVRVIDYRLEGVADAEPIYRLVTSILDPDRRRLSNWPPSITSAGKSRRRSTN